jgi:FdhD protein
MSRPTSVSVDRIAVRRSLPMQVGVRRVPEETAVALVFNGTSHAVMMATPADYEDFAVGFALSEEIVAAAAEIESIEAVELEAGVELRLWIDARRMAALSERRRQMAGPTGCGLCGVESLAAALRPLPSVGTGVRIHWTDVPAAFAALAGAQTLNAETRAVHAAGFWTAERGLVAAREDVGRHNALDKLVGALARQSLDPTSGIVVVTSRVSIEMVQKTVIAGATVLAAVSAPTAHAIRLAEATGLTLVAVARGDDFEVFTAPGRIAIPSIASTLEMPSDD